MWTMNVSLPLHPPLHAALRCVGRNPTSLRVEQYWSQHGGRGGEGLGYEQFKAIMRRERPTLRDDLVKAFARLDRNGDGYITADELMRVVTKVCVSVCVFACVYVCVRVCMSVCVHVCVCCKRR